VTRGLTPDGRTNETIAFACDGVRARIDCSRGQGRWKSAGRVNSGRSRSHARCVLPPRSTITSPRTWAHICSRIFRNGRLVLGNQRMRGRSKRPVGKHEPLELLLDSGFQAGGLVPGFLECGPAFQKPRSLTSSTGVGSVWLLPAVVRGRVRAKPAPHACSRSASDWPLFICCPLVMPLPTSSYTRRIWRTEPSHEKRRTCS